MDQKLTSRPIFGVDQFEPYYGSFITPVIISPFPSGLEPTCWPWHEFSQWVFPKAWDGECLK